MKGIKAFFPLMLSKYSQYMYKYTDICVHVCISVITYLSLSNFYLSSMYVSKGGIVLGEERV